ncbi:DUF6020 family protein [Alloscardovia macacae]|uniref:Beta-carotene 15,15'-monooxygenase n=1 Tax=Alloscardovia macacae TaxID=1160091 RepID=A0A261F6A4_9BIFI|nr:DUF6020 family protein [Alloscardovia macacae]OZG54605.1 beta-carotene 15,15'-monooxygenase [Alloscardovia macacae]
MSRPAIRPHRSGRWTMKMSHTNWTSILGWSVAVFASMWIAFCTSVGPIYRADSSIRTFGLSNALIFAGTWCVCMAVIWLFVRMSQPTSRARYQLSGVKKASKLAGKLAEKMPKKLGTRIVRLTDRWWKIAALLFAVWGVQFILVPSIFAADLMSQYAEMTRWIASLNGSYVSYADNFNVVDVYPIAHYMWPDTPTYLTNQHNVVLTFLYGGTLVLSQRFTGSIDLGLVTLSFGQMLFAVLTVSFTLSRFFAYARPLRVYNHRNQRNYRASGAWRAFILLFFVLNPQVLFSTTALTKSPLFAFAFLWWFGQWYEIFNRRDRTHIPRTLIAGIALSTAFMLISAKYATYIVAVQILLIFVYDRRRWRAHLVALVLPFIIFQGALNIAVNSGAIISGDSIESRGIQIQQIARVMREDPESVSASVRAQLRPIFNLYAMGAAYNPDDADRVKSSGGDGKVETYKWETVTADDMARFNRAWLSLGRSHPVTYIDAFLAKVYGYFDVFDPPYVATSYYLDNSRISNASLLQYWMPSVRSTEYAAASFVGGLPVLGWITHGNFYVVMCILLGCAVILLRRWGDVMRYVPLVLLIGVMMMAPANNFERHMLPLAFCAWLMLLQFVHDGRAAWGRERIARVM